MRYLILTLILGLLLVGNLASAQPEQITTTGGSSPTVSPDGSWLAFVSSGAITKIPAVGGAPTFLANGFDPDWSPVGNQIVYVKEGPGFPSVDELSVVDANSGVSTPVATGSFDRPAWSPDGTEIACTGDPSVKIVAYPSGDVSVPPCTGECHGEDPDWNHDGSMFCFEDGLQIMTLPRVGGAATTLVNTGNDVSYPTWSADGRYVAFSRNNSDSSANHIWVVDVATKALRQITSGPYNDYGPAWAPAGDWIYFRSDRSGSGEVWRVSFNEEVPVPNMGWSSLKARFSN